MYKPHTLSFVLNIYSYSIQMRKIMALNYAHFFFFIFQPVFRTRISTICSISMQNTPSRRWHRSSRIYFTCACRFVDFPYPTSKTPSEWLLISRGAFTELKLNKKSIVFHQKFNWYCIDLWEIWEKNYNTLFSYICLYLYSSLQTLVNTSRQGDLFDRFTLLVDHSSQ